MRSGSSEKTYPSGHGGGAGGTGPAGAVVDGLAVAAELGGLAGAGRGVGVDGGDGAGCGDAGPGGEGGVGVDVVVVRIVFGGWTCSNDVEREWFSGASSEKEHDRGDT
jgi:hypothetical protein